MTCDSGIHANATITFIFISHDSFLREFVAISWCVIVMCKSTTYIPGKAACSTSLGLRKCECNFNRYEIIAPNSLYAQTPGICTALRRRNVKHLQMHLNILKWIIIAIGFRTYVSRLRFSFYDALYFGPDSDLTNSLQNAGHAWQKLASGNIFLTLAKVGPFFNSENMHTAQWFHFHMHRNHILYANFSGPWNELFLLTCARST